MARVPAIEDCNQLDLSARDVVVLLQPASPLRTAAHIRDALAVYRTMGLPLVSMDLSPQYPGWRGHEFRAWQELCADYAIGCDYLGFAERGRQVLLRIVDIQSAHEKSTENTDQLP